MREESVRRRDERGGVRRVQSFGTGFCAVTEFKLNLCCCKITWVQYSV